VPDRTKLNRFSPIFPVRDLAAALSHYASLGFKTTPYEDAEPWSYGFADRDGVQLHLSLFQDHEHHDHDDHDHDEPEGEHHHHEFAPGACYLYVEDADELGAEWSAPGIGGQTFVVRDTPYGLREGAHVDPDGNDIRFGSPMEGA
jgi:catechol 2,3-dioxygenase-like lactoylglutathione lyase family enzyme